MGWRNSNAMRTVVVMPVKMSMNDEVVKVLYTAGGASSGRKRWRKC